MPMDLKDKFPFKNKSFSSSFRYALEGFHTVFKEERNMKTHCLFAIVVMIMGVIFHLSVREWLWLLLVIFLVLVMETLNTIAENIVDMITEYKFHPIGKKVKDMAAAAVLMTAIFAVIVGIIIFFPKMMKWIK